MSSSVVGPQTNYTATGLAADRPASPSPMTFGATFLFYQATDTNQLSFWNGSAWQNVGAGTVTSVGASGGTTGFSFTGSPITGSGTLTLSGTLGVANGGTGATSLTGYLKGNGTSAFTAVSTVAGSDVSGNITGNAANVTGTVAVAHGGTGQTSFTDGQLLIGNTTGNTLTPATLTAGSNVTITNGHGTITIAASGGGGSGTTLATVAAGTETALTVSSIPQVSGATLEIEYTARCSAAAVTAIGNFTVNGSSSAIYSIQRTYFHGTTPSADSSLGQTAIANILSVAGASAQANDVSYARIRIPLYAGTTFYKAGDFITRQANGTTNDDMFGLTGAILIHTTSAITSVTFTLASGTHVAGSTLTVRVIP